MFSKTVLVDILTAAHFFNLLDSRFITLYSNCPILSFAVDDIFFPFIDSIFDVDLDLGASPAKIDEKRLVSGRVEREKVE